MAMVEKMKKDRRWYQYGIEEKDIDSDGREDLVLWHVDGYLIRPKATITVFARQENGELPEKPNQIIRSG